MVWGALGSGVLGAVSCDRGSNTLTAESSVAAVFRSPNPKTPEPEYEKLSGRGIFSKECEGFGITICKALSISFISNSML